MAQRSFDSTSSLDEILVCGLTPSGHIELETTVARRAPAREGTSTRPRSESNPSQKPVDEKDLDSKRSSAQSGPPEAGGSLPRIVAAFASGDGHGLLHLGAAEPGTSLQPTLAYWRDFGQALVARVCGRIDPTDPRRLEIPAPVHEELRQFIEAAPPMRGAEFLTPELLERLWASAGKAM